MKASQDFRHLGQSIALGLVLVGASMGVVVIMMLQSGVL